MKTSFYPKILICSLNRINKDDASNNSLLLKNLISSWPKENLAQIYSGGSNGDEGYCGWQYPLGEDDRRFGKLFFKIKGSYGELPTGSLSGNHVDNGKQAFPIFTDLKRRMGKYFIDSGLYELLFRLCPSRQMIDWVRAFNPDIILAQGYNLTFSWLPIFIKKTIDKPMAFYCSDDWPSSMYASRNGRKSIVSALMRQIVRRSTKNLFDATDVPFAFNDMMGDEYQQRYGKKFKTLMHCDQPERFDNAEPVRFDSREVKTVVAAGTFDDSRWPLLLDLEEACAQLNAAGVLVRAHIITPRISEEGCRRIKSCRFLILHEDPGHDRLPSYLKGADVLFLSETFDPEIAFDRRFSVSTKAHLFMFSRRPILVYGHPANGVVEYARKEGWGETLLTQDIDKLRTSLQRLLSDENYSRQVVARAESVTQRNHDINAVQHIFKTGLIAACK